MNLKRFEYTDVYQVGVPEIDQQHTRFFEIYNDLADRVAGGQGITEAEVFSVFNDLFMYTKYHFREEEWIMKTAEYPELGDHLDQHQSLIDGLAKMRRNAATLTEIVSAIELFIKVWAEHITIMDHKLGLFLLKQ